MRMKTLTFGRAAHPPSLHSRSSANGTRPPPSKHADGRELGPSRQSRSALKVVRKPEAPTSASGKALSMSARRWLDRHAQSSSSRDSTARPLHRPLRRPRTQPATKTAWAGSEAPAAGASKLAPRSSAGSSRQHLDLDPSQSRAGPRPRAAGRQLVDRRPRRPPRPTLPSASRYSRSRRLAREPVGSARRDDDEAAALAAVGVGRPSRSRGRPARGRPRRARIASSSVTSRPSRRGRLRAWRPLK